MRICQVAGKKTTLHASLLAVVIASMGTIIGCELDSFFDPSVVGRWERTPVTLPILTRMDLIEPNTGEELPISSVEVEDLVPSFTEYRIQPGDTIRVSIFELYAPGVTTTELRRVNNVGKTRLPVIGELRIVGVTPSGLEKIVADILDEKGVLRDAEVNVSVVDSVFDTFTVYGEPVLGSTNIGTYAIPRPDFRLLDALALARGVPGRTRKLWVYRTSQTLTEDLMKEQLGQLSPEALEGGTDANAEELVDTLINQMGPDANDDQPVTTAAERMQGPRDEWINVDGRWVRAASPGDVNASELNIERLAEIYKIRIIEIPYQALLDGDVRYNIVIRAGDLIRIPPQRGGFVYAAGEIARPGAYTVPAENELTVTGLIAAAGGLGSIAIPDRVDLRRRVGLDHEAIVRFNLRDIYDGQAPNFYLKPNDEVNVGTNFLAQPLAVFRNGLRMSYGFGFILDRNFNSDVFGNNN